MISKNLKGRWLCWRLSTWPHLAGLLVPDCHFTAPHKSFSDPMSPPPPMLTYALTYMKYCCLAHLHHCTDSHMMGIMAQYAVDYQL